MIELRCGYLSCMVHLIVCSDHVTYAFQSESTLCSFLNLKELLAWNRREIWSLSDDNWTRTHSHLVRKWTLNHLAKLANCVLIVSYDINPFSGHQVLKG